MLNILNDPEIDKLIIYTLIGICAVLFLAVLILAIRRNIYYVDEDGIETTPPPKKKLFGRDKGEYVVPAAPAAPAAQPVEEPVPQIPAQPAVSNTVADIPIPAMLEEEEAEAEPILIENGTEPVLTEEPLPEEPAVEEAAEEVIETAEPEAEVPAVEEVTPEAPVEETPAEPEKKFDPVGWFKGLFNKPKPAEAEAAAAAAGTIAAEELSEDSFANEFSLPEFMHKDPEAAETVGEISPLDADEVSEIPDRSLSEEEMDAAVNESMADIPSEETEAEDEIPVPAPPAEAEPFIPAPPSEEVKVPTGLEVAVVIGNNVREYSINQLPCLLGRDAASCDLVISEPAVSRRHARIVESGGKLYIEDVSEHNGTFLNAVKLPPLGREEIKPGDRITLGRATIDVTKELY